MNPQIEEVIAHLEELKEDLDTNKKLKEKTDKVISILTKGEEMHLDKALMELDDMNSLNLAPYHRTRVWDIVSLLESLKN